LAQNTQKADLSSIRFIGSDEHPLPISESAASFVSCATARRWNFASRGGSFITSDGTRQSDTGGGAALMRDSGETYILIASGKFIVDWQL
jgi:hypothetical protein